MGKLGEERKQSYAAGAQEQEAGTPPGRNTAEYSVRHLSLF